MMFQNLVWFMSWIGCTPSQPESTAWSRDPSTLEQQCTTERSPEVQTTCWVQLAALHGELGNEFQGIQACAQIAAVSLSKTHPETQQVWEWECAFRLGEELANSGQLSKGLKHCSMAGRFAQNCITHAIWRHPLATTLNSTSKASTIWTHAQERQSASLANLQSLSPDLQQDASNQLIGQFGLGIFFGSGILNPESSHLSNEWGASLRTGYAMEKVRLATAKQDRWSAEEIQQLFDSIMKDWRQNDSSQGDAHPNPLQLGRYAQARLSPFERDLPKLHLYGGGRRLIHQKVETDMHIALIEAFFWYTHTPPAWFTRWFEHPEPLIQLTSIKLFCLSNGLRSNIRSKMPNTPEFQWHVTTCPLSAPL